jgi:hypothetical protein
MWCQGPSLSSGRGQYWWKLCLRLIYLHRDLTNVQELCPQKWSFEVSTSYSGSPKHVFKLVPVHDKGINNRK